MSSDNPESKNKSKVKPKGNAWALLPMLVLVVIYVGFTILIKTVPVLEQNYDSVPIVLVFSITLIFTLFQNRKNSIDKKFGIIGKGIGNTSIIYMIVIFLAAGIFAGTVGRSSASSVAYFFLDVFPAEWSVLIIFIVSCLVSLAMGTSVGAITLITPIAVSVASASGQDLPICVASVICGSMFGDNLSMISDTSIAACTGMGCAPKEKFLENFKIVLPAAIITIVLISCLTLGSSNGTKIIDSYNMIEFIPYILVLILSVLGINVLIVLGIGVLSGIVLVLYCTDFDVISLFNNMAQGASSMSELIVITLIVAGMAALIRANGGFEYVLYLIERFCKTKKMAQFSTGLMTSLINFITANNTVAIVVATPIAKEVCASYHIRRRRMASIVDTFSCFVQGLLPYGAQMMMALLLCQESGYSINAFDVIPVCFYQYILFAVVLFFIFTGLSDKKPNWSNKVDGKMNGFKNNKK